MIKDNHRFYEEQVKPLIHEQFTCKEQKVKMYKKFGFTDRGEANSSWGGQKWHKDDRREKILENQQIIKTPVVRNGKAATLGYQPDAWKEWK